MADKISLRILLLCYEYPPLGGGGGVGAQQYAEAWAAKGHTVSVITGGGGGLSPQELMSGVHIVRVGTARKKDRATSTPLSMATYLASGALHIWRRRTALRQYDIINTHFALPTGPLGWLASKILRLPNVLTIIGGDIYDPTKKSSPHRHSYWRAINRRLMNAADEVIAISSDTRHRAQHYYGITRPIEVVPYGFRPLHAPDRPRGLGGTNRHYRLISVGRLIKRKGFAFLIEALPRLPQDVELLLVGDGPLEAELKQVAARMGVTNRIAWLGYRSREEIYQYLQEAQCFVLPSLHEGLGIVVQEAMYAGLPVVATNNGGQVDLIKNGHNGLLVEPGNVDALVRAINALYHDRKSAQAMARRNKLEIKDYSVEHNCLRYLDVFRRHLSDLPEARTERT